MMYKRILLTLDGSSLAEQALPHAVAQAKHFQAELILLKVNMITKEKPALNSEAIAKAEELVRISAIEYLERVAAGIQDSGIKVETDVIDGASHEAIIQYTEEYAIDLIVISSRGQSGFNRWIMGSVADRVIRGTNIPVLLIRVFKQDD
jgi:nucleotide-binding universal stress UspA family protein